MLNIVLFPFRFLYKIYFAIWFSVLLIVLYPVFKIIFLNEKRFKYAFTLMRAFAKILMFVSGVWIKVENREKFSVKGPYLICANHSSFLDIPVIYAVFPTYFTFVGKKEIEKWPLFRIFYTSGMNILVDRHNQRGDIKAFRSMIKVIDKGDPLFIFPEGTITKNAPKMGEFKSGAVSIALKKKIPILPITFVSNWKRLERKGIFKGKAGPGNSKVIVHDFISPEEMKDMSPAELIAKLKTIIGEPIGQ